MIPVKIHGGIIFINQVLCNMAKRNLIIHVRKAATPAFTLVYPTYKWKIENKYLGIVH